MQLDEAAGQVDEDRRARHETEGCDDGAQSPLRALGRRSPSEDCHHGRFGEAVQHPHVLHEGEEEDHGNVQPEEHQDRPVALGPDLVRQRAALRQPTPEATSPRSATAGVIALAPVMPQPDVRLVAGPILHRDWVVSSRAPPGPRREPSEPA